MTLHLAVIGAPKAGTTVLHHYLDQHPRLLMASPKEPHFFDANYNGNLKAYLDHFFPKRDDHHLIGEATPHSLFVPYVAARLREHAPEVHLVAVLRDPVERAYSDWWMYWTRATEPLPFDKAIDANLHRLQKGPSFLGDEAKEKWCAYYRQTQSGSPGEIEHRPYVEIGHYADQIERYLEHFDREQFSIVLSSDLREEPGSVVRSIWRELDLNDDVPLAEPERTNEAMGGISRHLYSAARNVGLESLLHALPRGVRTRMKKLSAHLDERPPMPPDARKRLAVHYEPFNNRLEKLLGRDLSHWTRPS